MTHEQNTTQELDRLVRQALEPDAAAVERTVDAALRTERRVPWMAWAAAATIVVALTVVGVLYQSPESPAPPAPATPRVFVISNADGLVTLTTPDGARFVVGKRG